MSVLPVKVLVTGAGALLGQGIIKSLQRSSLQVRIAAADPSPLSAGLFWAEEAHIIRMATAADYLDRLEEVLRESRPDVVIPGTDVELPILSANRERLEKEYSTHVLVSDPRVIAIADDKFLTYQFLDGADLSPPSSALPENRDAVEALIAAVGFPLIVKPRVGARSVGVSLVSSREGLELALAGREGLVVQECVAGDSDEYTASVLVFDGVPEASIVMRRDLRDGNTYRAYTGAFPELNDQVRKLGAALRPYGPANFQFRLDRDGTARVFEINGRFSGTTPLRALVGFNEVEMCLRRILFNEPVRQPPTRDATILRFWSETMVEPEQLKALR